MRILIIGGTAFMGPFVARLLSEQGHEVTVYHRGHTETELPDSVAHIRNPDSSFPIVDFPQAVRDLQPEVVLHMLAMSERDAHALMDTFRGSARRVVVASSADVYRAFGRLIGIEHGDPDPAPISESSPLRERLYPYRTDEPPTDGARPWTQDYDKILVERIVLGDDALPGTVLRLPMVYGPGDRQHRLWSYLKRMDDRRPAILMGATQARWRTTRGYVENVAAAIALAVTDDRAAGRIYNVAELDAPEEAEWAQQIAVAVGWDGEIVVVDDDQLPAHLAGGGDLRHDLAMDSLRIRQELGFTERVPRGEALLRTVAWERAHPPADDPAQFDYAAEDEVLARIRGAR